MHKSTNTHWIGVKRVLWYINVTNSYRTMIHYQSSMALHAFFDADWTGNPDDRTSINVYLFFWAHAYFLELKETTFNGLLFI